MCELIWASEDVSVVTCQGEKFRAVSFRHARCLFSSIKVSVIK